jgi:hypothetical protein
MGQTVVLHRFEQLVDPMHALVAAVFRGMEQPRKASSVMLDALALASGGTAPLTKLLTRLLGASPEERGEGVMARMLNKQGSGDARAAADATPPSSSSGSGRSAAPAQPDIPSTRDLYRYLAEISSIRNAVVLSGLRTTSRPGSVAWNDPLMHAVHEALCAEFDLEARYEELERKLEFISETIQYALEVGKSEQTVAIERVIVYLIAAELALSLFSWVR